MILDLMVWAPDREAFVAGMLANGLMQETADGLIPTADVSIDEVGTIVSAHAVYDEEGVELSPAVLIPGWHANLRAYGDFAAQVTYGLDQTDPEGNLLSIFDRTYLLYLVPGLEWQELSTDGVPSGYVGPNGVKLFDPRAVSTPRRVWA